MSAQYGRKCFLCNNTRYRNKQCRLFRFPARGTPMWSKWLAVLGLTDADINVHSNAPPHLCQLHFEPKDFLQRRLSAMAVPKVHERNRDKKKMAKVLGDEEKLQISVVVEKTHKAIDDDNLPDVRLDGGQGSGSEADHNVDDETFSNCQEDLFEAESCEYESCYAPVLDATVEQSVEAALENSFLSSPPECNITQHETLTKQLEKERARVKELLEENAQQRHIIEDQRNLLLQLGVQYTILDESEGDS